MSLSWETPGWLALLPAVLWYGLWLRGRTLRPSAWRELIDPPLRGQVLLRRPGRRRGVHPWVLFVLAAVLATLALAGPVVQWGTVVLDLTPGLLLGVAGLAASGLRRGWLSD